MAKSQKYTHEQLQKDEVAESLQHIVLWLHRNKRRLLWTALLILATIVIGYGWRSHQARLRMRSNALMEEALLHYQALTNQTEPGQRETAMEDAVASARALVEQYPNTPLGREAHYLMAKAYYEMGRFEPARQAYQAYIDAAETRPQRARGEIGLGYAHENESFFMTDLVARTDKLDTALGHYESALRLAPPESFLYYYALLSQARIYDLTGQDDQARERYQRIIDERPAPAETALPDARPQRQPNDPMARQLLDRIRQAERQLSLAATARLRLQRLEATSSKAVPTPPAPLDQPEPAADGANTGTTE